MQTDKWHAVAPLNTPRQQLGVCELKGRLFAVGGSDGYIRLDSVEVFSEEAKRWTYMKSLNTCRSGVGVCAIGNTLYALGGYDGRLCLNTVERYDSELDIWHYVAPTIVTRSFPGAHLYCCFHFNYRFCILKEFIQLVVQSICNNCLFARCEGCTFIYCIAR